MPGDIGECLPDSREITLPIQEERASPDFRFRDIGYAYGSSAAAATRRAEWLRRNRMHRPDIQHGHNLTETLGRVAPFSQRPELYALIHGQRQKTQICTSNPEATALVVKSIKQYLKQNPDTEAYSLCPDDNHDFCECADCRDQDSGRTDRGGLPSVADRYQVFLNQVLGGLKDEHPQVLATTYSYNLNHTDPPVNTPVDPRTCIFATTSEFCSAHGIGDASCVSRQDFRSLLEKWTAATPHVFIYDYDPVPYSGALPWPMWEAHAGEMAAYKEIGVKGVYFEGQNSWAAYFPNYYIAAQCMWDSSRDAEQLFKDLMQAFFREASPEMTAYYQSLASAFHELREEVPWGLTRYPKYFTPEIVERCRKALEAAEAKDVSPLVRTRIEMVRLSFDEMDSYLTIRRADDSISFDQYKAAVDRLGSTIDRMATINEDYILANVAKGQATREVAERHAREQGFINQWMLCGPFDNLGMEGHDRVYSPEEKTNAKATYIGKDGQSLSWQPNHTPEWQGYVNLLNEFSETDWVCAYALCWVTLDKGPRDVMFRLGSNDSIKAFVNGQPVWSNKTERVAFADQDAVPLTLPQGTSPVLLKIGQSGHNWGFFFRITERDSLDIPAGLHTSPQPPD
jgi:hypothetical protein